MSVKLQSLVVLGHKDCYFHLNSGRTLAGAFSRMVPGFLTADAKK